MPMAAVCEFIHTASLLHDDVVDDSTLRRNRPTANTIWGSAASVLVGDLIYSRASELMAATGNVDVVDTFARSIRLMSEGELLQLENVFSIHMSESDYFSVISNKTAALIAATCSAPAMLAGCTIDQIQRLALYGEKVGLAFQIIDDLLDYFAKADELGKPVGADFMNGRITLPLIYLMQVANPTDKAELIRIYSDVTPANKRAEDLQFVMDCVTRYETAHRALEKARQLSSEAIACLSVFPESPARNNMTRVAEALMLRQA